MDKALTCKWSQKIDIFNGCHLGLILSYIFPRKNAKIIDEETSENAADIKEHFHNHFSLYFQNPMSETENLPLSWVRPFKEIQIFWRHPSWKKLAKMQWPPLCSCYKLQILSQFTWWRYFQDTQIGHLILFHHTEWHLPINICCWTCHLLQFETWYVQK